MAKTKIVKEQAMQVLIDELNQSKLAVFANFQGLKVKESEELRKLCREQKIKYIASKKTLLKQALSNQGLKVDTKSFEGGVAVMLGKEDEVAPAQLIAKFARTHELAKIFGGILEGKYIDEIKVKELAKLPNKQQLLGQLVGTINAPISGFVNVLVGNLRNLVSVLNNVKESKV